MAESEKNEKNEKARNETRTTLRNLQHDLRTPIGQILGYSEMLQEELEERQLFVLTPDLDRVRSAANTLLTLVDGIFRPEEISATPADAAAIEPLGNAGLVSQVAARAHLLLVDDEPANRDLFGRQLERAGYRVTEAASGREALQLISDHPFDLVLLDVLMPEMNGMETLVAIRRSKAASELPIIMATALSGPDDVVDALAAGANDYVTKPFDMPVVSARIQMSLSLRAATDEIEQLAQQLEIRNAFLRRTFGRYLSDEVVANLLDNDDGLQIGGERRKVTILMADLRGFTSLTESIGAAEIVAILNSYLSIMADVIQEYRGTVDEFLGDAILAHFGAVTTGEDDAERAVACAVAMQQAISEVNRVSAERGLPAVEMGIGIATGNVIVGNLGSETRSKHTAIGSAVNLAARIEGQTLGGEVLISEATFEEVRDLVEVDAVREVWPKGFDSLQTIHRVVRIDGDHNLSVPVAAAGFIDLTEPIGVSFSVLEGKEINPTVHFGEIISLSSTGARIATTTALAPLTELRVAPSADASDASYAKVVDVDVDAATATMRFTMKSPVLNLPPS